jgi:hypothetical protein
MNRHHEARSAERAALALPPGKPGASVFEAAFYVRKYMISHQIVVGRAEVASRIPHRAYSTLKLR